MGRFIRIVIAFLFIVTAVCVLQTPPARAAGVSTGGYLWVAWWEPAFRGWMDAGIFLSKKIFIGNKPSQYQDAMILAGPVLAIEVSDRVSLSTVFTMSQGHRNDTAVDAVAMGQVIPVMNRTFLEVKKYDLDEVLSVRLARILRLYVGVKYQHLDYSKLERYAGGGVAGFVNSHLVIDTVGAGLGLGLAIPLSHNFSLQVNATGLYQYPLMKLRTKGVKPLGFSVIPYTITLGPEYHIAGANGVVSLAYLIANTPVTIALGFRYQYLTYRDRSKPSGNMLVRFNLSGRQDQFFGATLMAAYTIDFTPQREGDRG